MHEFALIENVVAMVEERVGRARVASVELRVGQLAGVLPDALRFCFEACAHGTALEGATLVLDETAGRGRCRACGAPVAMESFLDLCECGSADIEVLGGQELRVTKVEVH